MRKNRTEAIYPPPDLAEDAKRYQTQWQTIEAELKRLHHDRDENRKLGLWIIRRMQQRGIAVIQAGDVYLRPHADGLGFERTPIFFPRQNDG